ncbi:MAG: queuosine precursor transporter [Deltaproteobacteria bacterium]|nr:queuosine precursor transporter [Myxococcales bacterium]MDP3219442.1 queuosine precursor transporter [Deltaproteobacteria bacterium]
MADDPTRPVAPRFRYFDLIVGVFVTALITSNLVSAKVAQIGPFKLGCGIFVFPISYIFGDVLTEVYGYARSRRVIWIGFACGVLTSIVFVVADLMPPAPDWPHQAAFHTILGQLPRVVAASLVAYVVGEFFNSFVLAKMKLLTRGRHLWMRTIGSTVVGQGVDSAVFYPLAFYGIWSTANVVDVAWHNYLIKVAVETLFTPLTYVVVNYLKRVEHEDVFDTDTDFNPLKVSSG